jgi:hypothetical protein
MFAKREPMKIANGAIYLTDNDRALCGAHVGATARTTGRGLSGRLIYRVTPWDVEEGGPIACEICGRQASGPFPAHYAESVAPVCLGRPVGCGVD